MARFDVQTALDMLDTSIDSRDDGSGEIDEPGTVLLEGLHTPNLSDTEDQHETEDDVSNPLPPGELPVPASMSNVSCGEDLDNNSPQPVSAISTDSGSSRSPCSSGRRREPGTPREERDGQE